MSEMQQVAQAYEPGTRIEVRNAFGRWSRGFEVEAVCDKGWYKIRRLSDASVLPVDVEPDAVRRERRRDDFWWH